MPRYRVIRGRDQVTPEMIAGMVAIFESDDAGIAVNHACALELDQDSGEWWILFDEANRAVVMRSDHQQPYIAALRARPRDPLLIPSPQNSLDATEHFCNSRDDYEAWKIVHHGQCIAESDPTWEEVGEA